MLGRHEGTYNFTIGQRKGLGVAAAEPLYVVAVDAAERRVVVGRRAERLQVGVVRVEGLVWHRALGGGPLDRPGAVRGRAPLPRARR